MNIPWLSKKAYKSREDEAREGITTVSQETCKEAVRKEVEAVVESAKSPGYCKKKYCPDFVSRSILVVTRQNHVEMYKDYENFFSQIVKRASPLLLGTRLRKL